MNLYLMNEATDTSDFNESLGVQTQEELKYCLDIIRRTLALLRAGPLDAGMTDLSISRLESVEDKLVHLLGEEDKSDDDLN